MALPIHFDLAEAGGRISRLISKGVLPKDAAYRTDFRFYAPPTPCEYCKTTTFHQGRCISCGAPVRATKTEKLTCSPCY